jgi:hypothetical protein
MPPAFLFSLDFLLNTVTKYLDHIKALPIIQRDPVMLERYNDVISRNVMTCTLILDEGKGGMSDALRTLKPRGQGSGRLETPFSFSDEVKAKARVLMHENKDMPEYK